MASKLLLLSNAGKLDIYCCIQDVPASEAAETEYETTFPRDSSFSEHEVTAVADHQSSEAELHDTGSYYEEHEPTASDEDSDSDDTNTSRHRDRFRTERDTIDTTLSLPTPVNKAEKRDIPDTLGKTYWLHL